LLSKHPVRFQDRHAVQLSTQVNRMKMKMK